MLPTDEMYIAQAAVLIPVTRALEGVLGREEAHRLINDALRENYRDVGRRFFGEPDPDDPDFGARMAVFGQRWLADTGFEIELVGVDENKQDANMTRCRIAEFYKENDAQDLGLQFACGQDYSLTEAMGDDVVLERRQTLMEGHSHCKFHWYRTRDDNEASELRVEELANHQSRVVQISITQRPNDS